MKVCVYIYTPGSSCFSFVFIKNIKTINQNTRKKMLLFVLSGTLTVIYNMYKSMTY